MAKKGFSEKILVGLTGKKDDWKSKLREINKYKIKKISLFLERFKPHERKQIYKALLKSEVKSIPLTHLRNDMKKEEIDFLVKNFGTTHITIHENSFKYFKKWNGHLKKFYLEMNADNHVPKMVDLKRIGGFCIDFSHFKIQEERFTKEFEYILKRKNVKRYFGCNHLNGYSYEKNCDLHTIKSLDDFNYLISLPKFLFSDLIGLETDNSIKEQLKFKKHVARILDTRFGKQKDF
ncbi:MAG: hypothetical protein QW404_00535 [Candidatus Nanoarchaeia archaeon]